MENSIVVRTDASVKDKKGAGIAYDGVVFQSDGSYKIYTDSDYIPRKIKTTDAETLAAAYGLKEIFYKIDEPENYNITVKSDCKHTIRVIEDKIDSDVERVISFFAEQFNDFEVKLIPRCDNEKADALARNRLDNGYAKENE